MHVKAKHLEATLQGLSSGDWMIGTLENNLFGLSPNITQTYNFLSLTFAVNQC